MNRRVDTIGGKPARTARWRGARPCSSLATSIRSSSTGSAAATATPSIGSKNRRLLALAIELAAFRQRDPFRAEGEQTQLFAGQFLEQGDAG